jgi:hypothetical protein
MNWRDGSPMSIHDHSELVEFRRAAERFCGLLEFEPPDAERWVEDILAALAKLYACGHALPEPELPDDSATVPDSFGVSDDEWKRVLGLVHRTLGAQVGYWAYFDPSEPSDTCAEPVFGDLGDDLADIYRDVKPGLRAWDMGMETHWIVFGWKYLGFGSHWGVHAVSAMRALHPIAFLRGVHKNA